MKRVVFLHIPKAAGSSLVLHLQANLRRRGWPILRRIRCFRPTFLTGFHDHLLSGERRDEMLRKARSATLVHGHFSWGSYEEMGPREDDVLITLLRDPADRLRSGFRFAKSLGEEHPYLPAARLEAMKFSEFLATDIPEMKRQADNGMTRCLGGAYGVEPKSDEEWRNLLSAAKANLERFSVVGFVHQFDRSIRQINRACGFRDTEAEPNNVTPGRFREQADGHDDTAENPEAAAVLESSIRYDQQLFTYAKERFGGD